MYIYLDSAKMITGNQNSGFGDAAGEFSLDDSKRLCILTLEKALKQLPEGKDTVLGVFDLKGFKQKNGDLGFAGFLVGPNFTFVAGA